MSKSPLKFADPFTVGAIISGVGAVGKLIAGFSGRSGRIREQKQAQEEYRRRMSDYEKLDTSNIYADVKNPYEFVQNPYANIETQFENVFEDMTVNQQQAQFEKQMFQQQQADTLQGLRGAAGGSGIAGLAQAMANQGQLQAQRAAASIGAQESQIQQLTAQGADQARRMRQQAEITRMQGAEEANRLRMQGAYQAEMQRLSGEETSRGLEYQKTGTMLGMSQQRVAAANLARQQALQNQMSAFGDIAGLGLGMMKGPGGGSDGSGPTYMQPKGPQPLPVNPYSETETPEQRMARQQAQLNRLIK
tara:strand:+ start:297 stop:1211 length:915 start_codon:yes stop_codon:yes gene_type:complete